MYKNNETELADAVLEASERLGLPIKDNRVQNDPKVDNLRKKDDILQAELSRAVANMRNSQL